MRVARAAYASIVKVLAKVAFSESGTVETLKDERSTLGSVC